MNEEIIYGVKIADSDSDKDREVPRLAFGEIHPNNGSPYVIFTTVTDDTNDRNKLGGCINFHIGNKKSLMYSNYVEWFLSKRYTIVTGEKYEEMLNKIHKGWRYFDEVCNEVKNNKFVTNSDNVSWENKTTGSVCSSKVEKGNAIINYIRANADNSDNFKRFSSVIDKYPNISFNTIYNAVTGSGSCSLPLIKSNGIICGEDEMRDAIRALDFINRFQNFDIKGRRDYFNIALTFCFNHEGVDNEELYRKLKKKCNQLASMKNIEQAISEIDYIYNYRKNIKTPILEDYLKVKK